VLAGAGVCVSSVIVVLWSYAPGAVGIVQAAATGKQRPAASSCLRLLGTGVYCAGGFCGAHIRHDLCFEQPMQRSLWQLYGGGVRMAYELHARGRYK
jgi:hypothetical protein